MTGRCLPCLGHSASVPLWVLHSRCGVLPPPGDAGHYPCAPSVAPTPASPGLPTALRFCLWCPVGSFQEGPSTSHPSPSLASQLGEAERKAQPSVLTGTVLPLNVSSLVVVWAHGGGGRTGAGRSRRCSAPWEPRCPTSRPRREDVGEDSAPQPVSSSISISASEQRTGARLGVWWEGAQHSGWAAAVGGGRDTCVNL